MYALNLSEEKRVLSIAMDNPHLSKEMVRVENVPDEVLNSPKTENYIYSDGKFVYDPLPEPEPEPVEPTAEDDMQAMMIDHEYRLTLLELGITE